MPNARAPWFALILTLASLPVAAAQARPDAVLAVHTELANLNVCLPMAGGQIFAGGAGGLVLVDPASGLRPVGLWTALDGLPGTQVLSLLMTPAHTAKSSTPTLWVGTEAGLARMVQKGGRWQVAGTVSGQPVRAIVAHDGALWLATWGDGLLRVDERTMRSRSIAPALNLSAAAVHGGQLMVATSEGKMHRLSQGRLHAMTVAGLPRRLIWHLADGPAGLLVGTVDGLYRVAQGRASRLVDGDIRATVAHGGQVVAAARGAGLLGGDGRAASSIAALKSVQGVGVAGPTLCAATARGLWLHRSKTWQRAALSGLPEGDISALAWHDGGLWAGTYHRGLTRLVDGRWRSAADGRIDRRINALASASAAQGGMLWAATARGVYAIHGQQVRRWRREDGLPADDVHSLLVSPRGGVVVGTAAGAARLRAGRVQPLGAKQGLPLRAVWALAEGQEGDLWLGSSWGLYGWRGGKAQRYSMATGHLSGDWVTALATHKDRVWVGTYRHGVDRLERQPDGTWQATALGGGWINFSGLRLQDGQLLAATMDGLRSAPMAATGVGAKAHRWLAHDHLALGRDVTASLNGGGKLWVASRRGIVGLPAAATP